MRRTWSSSPFLPKFISVATVAVFAATALFTAPAQASRNGVEERLNTFAVGITFKFGKVDQLCSGALLTPYIVATAGHCAYGPTGEVGTDYLFTSPGTPLDAAIDPRIVQPKVVKIYTESTFSYEKLNIFDDIAFLQLDKPVTAKRYLKFATRDELNLLTESSTVTGYGYGHVYETGAGYSIYPRKYSLKWLPIDSSTAIGNTFPLTSATSAPCKGDSGGPILATLPSGKEVLLGMLSGADNVVDSCPNAESDGLFHIHLTSGYPYLALIAKIYNPAAVVVAPTPTPKVTTIKCKKGSVIKKVTALKPVCPKGYKLTK
jgi:hypothetical protein